MLRTSRQSSLSSPGRTATTRVHAESPPSLSRPRPVASYSSQNVMSSPQSDSPPQEWPSSTSSSRRSSSDSLASETSATSISSTSTRTVSQPLLQVVYTSAASSREVSKDEICNILQKSRENNAKSDITGLLLYRDGSFVQFIEGPQEQVEALFNRIEKDPRHHGVVRVMRRFVEKRDFTKWEMAFRDLDLERRAGHRHHTSSSQDADTIDRWNAREDGCIVENAHMGFSQILNVGLKIGDHDDGELRPDAYGIGRAKISFPDDMSLHMRKLISTFYRLLDRPL